MTPADKPACECHFCDRTGYIDGAQCIACFERENAKPPEPAPPCPRCDERHADDPDACLRDGYKMPKPEGREARVNGWLEVATPEDTERVECLKQYLKGDVSDENETSRDFTAGWDARASALEAARRDLRVECAINAEMAGYKAERDQLQRDLVGVSMDRNTQARIRAELEADLTAANERIAELKKMRSVDTPRIEMLTMELHAALKERDAALAELKDAQAQWSHHQDDADRLAGEKFTLIDEVERLRKDVKMHARVADEIATEKRTLTAKLEIATATLEWAVKQDWSFDNHGPEGMYTRLSETLSELKQEN